MSYYISNKKIEILFKEIKKEFLSQRAKKGSNPNIKEFCSNPCFNEGQFKYFGGWSSLLEEFGSILV